MTKPILAHEGQPLPLDLNHCPLCGGELQSGTDDRTFECPVCEYTEQEVVNA